MAQRIGDHPPERLASLDLSIPPHGPAAPLQRFLNVRRRLEQRLPLLDRVNLEQVELIRRFRAADRAATPDNRDFVPLLLSINCVAGGLGWTG